MKLHQNGRLVSIAGLILSMAHPLDQCRSAKDNEANEEKQKRPVSAPVYRPPKRALPGVVLGEGPGDFQREVFVLSVLAPDHTGLTVSEQPFLYWFMSNPTSFLWTWTVMDLQASADIRDSRPPSGPSRCAPCPLADYGIRLSSGAAYRWYVASGSPTLIVDPKTYLRWRHRAG